MPSHAESVASLAARYTGEMTTFLRDMIAIPSESADERAIVSRVAAEMVRVGFDEVKIDGLGNVLGRVGNGPVVVAIDGHLDTVGVGDATTWTRDPYRGDLRDGVIYGRGASDQEAGIASAVHGARIAKALGLLDNVQLWVTGTVMEEDCDGLCWQYLVEKSGIRPEFVVSTEPTSCRIHRGQRGRMEIKVAVRGVSAHGSAPERGDNAIFKMGPILGELQGLHTRLADDAFLGKGSLTVSEIFYTSPSRCAVADGCAISIDRRLTAGETWEGALEEIRRLPAVQKAGAQVSLYDYARPSYTGLVYPTECYFPCWVLEEQHPACQALVTSYQSLFAQAPVVDKWTFSTNGVSIMGRYGIPCVGFGPGHEDQAHAPNELTWKRELVQAAAMYAVIPQVYLAGC